MFQIVLLCRCLTGRLWGCASGDIVHVGCGVWCSHLGRAANILEITPDSGSLTGSRQNAGCHNSGRMRVVKKWLFSGQSNLRRWIIYGRLLRCEMLAVKTRTPRRMGLAYGQRNPNVTLINRPYCNCSCNCNCNPCILWEAV